MKKIETTRFGEIEIDEKKMIHFPEGLPGFLGCQEFIILEHKPDSSFMWLQSVEEPGLAFVMINPFIIKPDYLKDLSSGDELLISRRDDAPVMVFTFVTVPRDKPEKATVNLLGPIVVDTETMNASQVILVDSGYSHNHPLKSR